jgi:hypothetical protein
MVSDFAVVQCGQVMTEESWPGRINKHRYFEIVRSEIVTTSLARPQALPFPLGAQRSFMIFPSLSRCPRKSFSSWARKDSPHSSSPSRAHPLAPCYRRRSPRPSYIGYARHGLETRLYGARAKGAGHVLNRERYRLFGGESGSRKDEAKTTGSHGKQFDQWVSFQGLKR